MTTNELLIWAAEMFRVLDREISALPEDPERFMRMSYKRGLESRRIRLCSATEWARRGRDDGLKFLYDEWSKP